MLRDQISQIVDIIRRECSPKMIILFGSYARGEETPSSDVDIMVVLKEVQDRRKEMVRLQRLLHQHRIKSDVLIVTEKNFREWCETPGNVYFEAAQEGQVLFDDQAA